MSLARLHPQLLGAVMAALTAPIPAAPKQMLPMRSMVPPKPSTMSAGLEAYARLMCVLHVEGTPVAPSVWRPDSSSGKLKAAYTACLRATKRDRAGARKAHTAAASFWDMPPTKGPRPVEAPLLSVSQYAKAAPECDSAAGCSGSGTECDSDGVFSL